MPKPLKLFHEVLNSSLLENYRQIHQHTKSLLTFWLFKFVQYVLDGTSQMIHQGIQFFDLEGDLSRLKNSLIDGKLLKTSPALIN